MMGLRKKILREFSVKNVIKVTILINKTFKVVSQSARRVCCPKQTANTDSPTVGLEAALSAEIR